MGYLEDKIAAQLAGTGVAEPFPDSGFALPGSQVGISGDVSTSFVGNLANNAMFPPNLPSHDAPETDLYFQSLVASNKNRRYKPVRQVFGKWKVKPEPAATPFNMYKTVWFGAFDFGYGQSRITDVRIDGQSVGRMSNVNYEIKQNYTSGALKYYKNQMTSAPVNAEIKNSWIARNAPPNVNSNAHSIEIYFPNGLYKYDKSGLKVADEVIFDVNWNNGLIYTTWNALQTAEDVKASHSVRYIGNSQVALKMMWDRPFSLVISVTFYRVGHFALRVKRADKVEYLTNNKYSDKTVFKFIHSFENRIALKFYKPHTILDIRMTNADRNQYPFNNITAVVERMLDVWNGTTFVKQVTRNPAWAALEVLRGVANPKPVPDNRIDLASFKRWADYCDQNAAQGDPRFMYDADLTSETTVQGQLLEILQTARASLTIRNGKYAVIYENWPTTPTQVFTAANSWGFTGQRVFTRQPDGLIVQWTDPNLDYQRAELVVYADGKDETNSSYTESIGAEHITRWTQAYREGRYHLAVGRLRPEMFTIVTDTENLLCERGDRVRVQHDVPRVGGQPTRITAINGADVTLREPVVVAAGKTFDLLVRFNDGTSQIFGVTAQVDPYTVTLNSTPANANVGDLVVFGEHDKTTQDYLVKSITPGEQLTATLTLVPFAAAIQTADNKPIPPYQGPVNQDIWQPTCISNVTFDTSINHINRNPFAVVTALWESVSYAEYYDIYVKYPGGDFTKVAMVTDSIYHVFDNVPTTSGNYPDSAVQVKVVPVTPAGYSPTVDSCAAFSFEPPVDTTPPGKPLFFAGNVSGTIIHLTWLPPDDQDIAGYILRYTPDVTHPLWANAVIERELIPHDAFSLDVNVRIGSYLLKTIDTSGNLSPDYAVVSTTIPSLDGMNQVATATEEPGFTGVMQNVVKAGNSIRLDTNGPGPCGAYPWGTYTFDEANTVDAGGIYECYISTDMIATGDECVFMSDWLPTIADIDPIAATGQDDWDVVMQIRTATHLTLMMSDWLPSISAFDPIGTLGNASDWSGWQTLTAGYYTGRYFQFRAVLTSYNVKAWPVITRLRATVDMPDRIVSEHNKAVAAGGTHFTFPGGAFKNVPAVATTHDNANADDTLQIRNITSTGFDAEIFDNARKPIAGQIDYVARGYGKILAAMNPAIKAGDDDDIALLPNAIRRPTTSTILN